MLQLVGRFSSGVASVDLGISALSLIDGPDGPRIVAYSGTNGGIATYSVASNGLLTALGSARVSVGYGLAAEADLSVVQVGGATAIMLGVMGSAGLVGWGSNSVAAIGRAHVLPVPTAFGPTCLISSQPDADQPVFVVSPTTGRIGVFTSDSAAMVELTAPEGAFLGATEVAQTMLNGTPLLLTGNAATGQVATFAYDPATQTLTALATISAAQGLAVAAISSIETVSLGSATFAIVAAAGSSSLSVLRIEASGELTLTDHVIDSRDTRFANLVALDAIVIDGHSFVITGGGDDGLTLFGLMPDGQLLELTSFEDTLTTGLANVASVKLVAQQGRLLVVVGGETEMGLTVMSWDLGDLGLVIDGTSGPATLTGGAADDLITSGQSNQTLLGGAGDDILIAASPGVRMTGGGGGDSFLLRGTATTSTITDFQPGQDSFDPSGRPLLRDPSQLQITARSDGITVSFNDRSTTILSASGGPLTLADILPDGLGPGRIDPSTLLAPATHTQQDHSTPPPPPPPLPSQPPFPSPPAELARPNDWSTDPAWANGSARAIRLVGTDGNDTVIGASGRDYLDARLGNDLIYAGFGADTVMSGGGNDTLYDAGGNNDLWGGPGDDVIRARAGNDRIGGGTGNDFLDGGTGTNQVWGNAGNDTVLGAGANDELGGGPGNDRLYGYWGNDLIYSRTENDIIHAGAGNDTLWAGPGNDTITGAAGDDILLSGSGTDLVWGGTGADAFVFYRNYGNTTIADFAADEGDSLQLSRWMFGATVPSAAQAIALYGRVEASGAVLDMGFTGNVIYFHDMSDLSDLSGSLFIF